ncbi:hypothetical protein N2W54_001220 [Lotmaria passim]
MDTLQVRHQVRVLRRKLPELRVRHHRLRPPVLLVQAQERVARRQVGQGRGLAQRSSDGVAALVHRVLDVAQGVRVALGVRHQVRVLRRKLPELRVRHHRLRPPVLLVQAQERVAR